MTARMLLRALVLAVLLALVWTVTDELIQMVWTACALGIVGVMALYDRAVSAGGAS